MPQKTEKTIISNAFPSHEAWHSLQILSEMVQGYESLQGIEHGITIYGSARIPSDAPLYAETVAIGRLLAEAGYHVITGGGPGLMAAGNQGAHEAGKDSTGIRIRLPHEQEANSYMTNICYFNHFMVRKQMFIQHSKGYICVPGGLGTLDEFSEIFVGMQTGKVARGPIVLYQTSFWKGMIDWLRHSLAEGGYMNEEDLGLLLFADTPEEAFAHIQAAIPL